MNLAVVTDPVPLRHDLGGVIRVGQTRVTLETVVGSFEDGATPEEIVLHYPTLRLADVYAVIAYYLRHQEDVREYLREREEKGERNRQYAESQRDLVGIRARLLARCEQQQEQ
jgi:uncharacterized protein (DUF433 family)